VLAGFQSLLHLKAKFQPVYQPLYLTYPDPAALGSIATAIGRAYLPHLTSRQALRLLTKLRWPRTNRGRLAAPRRSGPVRSSDQPDLLEPVSGIEQLTWRRPALVACHMRARLAVLKRIARARGGRELDWGACL
jgi:hypothetical protein